ncbi:hypothetical protein STEG23_020133 [Scotinomys teguina]
MRRLGTVTGLGGLVVIDDLNMPRPAEVVSRRTRVLVPTASFPEPKQLYYQPMRDVRIHSVQKDHPVAHECPKHQCPVSCCRSVHPAAVTERCGRFPMDLDDP